jgi:hypothetical protein
MPSGPGIGVVAATYLQGPESVINYQNMSGTTSNVSEAQTFIQTLYHQELGRDAQASDLSFWLGVLQGPGGAAAVVDGIDHSPAAATRLVSGWFQRYLGRAPAGGEEQPLAGRIQKGEAEETVLADLLASKLVVNTDADFVQQLFTKLLNRPATGSEVALYVNTLIPQSGRSGATWLVLTSLDHRRLAVAEEYQNLLHRTGLSLSDLDYWAAGGLDLFTIHERLELTPDFLAANG